MKEFRSKRLRVWENISRTMQEFKLLLLGYRSYTALLTQTGTDAPVATVLENTLGEVPTWVYFSAGYFYVQSPLFEQNKTFLSIQKDFLSLSTQVTIPDKRIYYDGSDINGHYISIDTIGNDIASNGLLNYTAIEIRVYN